ncbi:hypothetical protein RBB50_007864 [Rhinocladiella similis]
MSTTITPPSIHVLGVSTGTEDSSFSSLEDKSNASPQLRLHGRIAIRTQDVSFDQVNVQVHGAIRNTIGPKVVVERFSSSTEVLSALDCKPAYSATRQDAQTQEEQHLDFSCLVPAAPRGRSVHKRPGEQGGREEDRDQHDGFIPSMSISGSTYVTRVTAIRDRHLVQGRCEVLYWLEAEFVKSRNNDDHHVVRRLTCPVDISSPNTPLEVEVPSAKHSSTSSIKRIAKPQTWSTTLRCLSSQSQPQVSVTLPRKLGYIVCDSSRLATGCRRLSIPVSVNVKKLPTHTHTHTGAMSYTTGSLKCSIKSQWYTRRSFNTGSSAVGSSVNSDTVSTHKTTLVLPPLYSSPGSEDDSTYTTAMDLSLLLPESSTIPSVSSDVLSVSYNLDVAMQFELVDGNGVKTAYSTELHLPVTLRTAPPQEMLTQHCSFDALLGYVEDDVRYAPPPYIC